MKICSSGFHNFSGQFEGICKAAPTSAAESRTIMPNHHQRHPPQNFRARPEHPNLAYLLIGNERMPRPISFACDPAEQYCECGQCALRPRRDMNLDALAEFNRATSVTVHLVILAASVLIFGAFCA